MGRSKGVERLPPAWRYTGERIPRDSSIGVRTLTLKPRSNAKSLFGRSLSTRMIGKSLVSAPSRIGLMTRSDRRDGLSGWADLRVAIEWIPRRVVEGAIEEASTSC